MYVCKYKKFYLFQYEHALIFFKKKKKKFLLYIYRAKINKSEQLIVNTLHKDGIDKY